MLILEDQADAAAMMKRELHKDDLAINLRRVDTRQGFTKALDTFQPDIVLVGSTLAGFDGSEALLYMRSNHPEIPAVIITEAPGEEAAIELLKAGAKDYGRLGPSVERALAIELGIRARKSAEKALRAANTPQQATEWIAHVGGFDGVSVSAIATIGIAQFSPEVPAPAELLKLADQALYQAKQQGRDRYCFHSPETDGVLRLNPSPA